MGLRSPDTIDGIRLKRDGKSFALDIEDNWDWSIERQHLEALQTKLNTYIHYIRSGDVYSHFPDATQRQFVITISAKHEFTETAFEFLKRAADVLSEFDIGLVYKRQDPPTLH